MSEPPETKMLRVNVNEIRKARSALSFALTNGSLRGLKDRFDNDRDLVEAALRTAAEFWGES